MVNVFDFDAKNAEPVYALLGHKENICALDTVGENTIISGSWDK
jgi:phospholipase A-2-activating protein